MLHWSCTSTSSKSQANLNHNYSLQALNVQFRDEWEFVLHYCKNQSLDASGSVRNSPSTYSFCFFAFYLQGHWNNPRSHYAVFKTQLCQRRDNKMVLLFSERNKHDKKSSCLYLRTFTSMLKLCSNLFVSNMLKKKF